MKKEKIIKKTFEIIEDLFQSEELRITRNELNKFIGKEYEIYSDIIKKGITSINKIEKIIGRTGGVAYSPAQKRRPELSPQDKVKIENEIISLLKNQDVKKERKNPEKYIEEAFKEWLKNNKEPSTIINFRSAARRNKKWKNVDGYEITPIQFKYHLHFKPILTTYEIKANLPSVQDISQAKNYLKFSNKVFLVFKDDRNDEDIKSELYNKSGLNPDDKLGIYVSCDMKNFKCIKDAVTQYPQEQEIDNAIEILLSNDDKEKLESIKYEYLQRNFINSIS